VSWEPLKSTKTYTFVIEDMANKLVFTTEVNGTDYNIDPKACNLIPGTVYAWYVHHPTKKEVSTPVFFWVEGKAAEEQAIEEIKSSDIYNKASNNIKLLMEAHQMEEKGFLLAAQEKYKKAMEMDPKNSLAKMMYSYYCKNLDEVESAAKALK
jgi:hypothetical protein